MFLRNVAQRLSILFSLLPLLYVGACHAGGSEAVGVPSDCEYSAAEDVISQCKVCHSTDASAGHATGPNLNGVIGRKAGSAEDFAYSPVIRKANIVWTEETLDLFLKDARSYLPGNRMAYSGVTDELKRSAVICYLKSLH